MIAFRKRVRSDEVVSPDKFVDGLIVWVQVEGEVGRQKRYCTGPNGALLTGDSYTERRQRIAEQNRATHRFAPTRKENRRSFALI